MSHSHAALRPAPHRADARGRGSSPAAAARHRVLTARSAGLLPASGVGALVVAATDLAARRLFSPDELPAGVLTAAVGAPVLLFLLVRVSRRSD